MLSDRIEWSAIEVELSPAFLMTEQFRQTFGEWLSAVREGPAPQPFAPGETKVGRLLSQLTTKQAWALFALIYYVDRRRYHVHISLLERYATDMLDGCASPAGD